MYTFNEKKLQYISKTSIDMYCKSLLLFSACVTKFTTHDVAFNCAIIKLPRERMIMRRQSEVQSPIA